MLQHFIKDGEIDLDELTRMEEESKNELVKEEVLTQNTTYSSKTKVNKETKFRSKFQGNAVTPKDEITVVDHGTGIHFKVNAGYDFYNNLLFRVYRQMKSRTKFQREKI